MTYNPTAWNDGAPPARSAALLNKQEEGIADAHRMYETGFGAAQAAEVDAGESTASDLWSPLATYGPAVDVQIGASGKALVAVTAQISSVGGGGGSMSFLMVWGAGPTTEAPRNTWALRAKGGDYMRATAESLVTGLPAQTTVKFEARYRADDAVAVTFNHRLIRVIPL